MKLMKFQETKIKNNNMIVVEINKHKINNIINNNKIKINNIIKQIIIMDKINNINNILKMKCLMNI